MIPKLLKRESIKSYYNPRNPWGGRTGKLLVSLLLQISGEEVVGCFRILPMRALASTQGYSMYFLKAEIQ